MAKVSVYNMEGKEVGTTELSDSIFGVEINEHLVHMAVLQQLANNRQGTQKAKTRSEVSGGGRKPWRQKGKPRPVRKYPAADVSPGDRREPVMQDRDPSELLSGKAAA